MRNKINIVRDTLIEDTNIDEEEGETVVVKYVDDVNVVELLDLERAASLFSVRKELKTIRAMGTEAVIYNIEENGKDIGMVINEKKTQSICISACNYHDVRSEIHTRNALISNNATLKVLGFVFDNHPTVSAHIENVSIKFLRSMWAIIHLKRAMIENGLLVEIYKSSLRPILEFSGLSQHDVERAIQGLGAFAMSGSQSYIRFRSKHGGVL